MTAKAKAVKAGSPANSLVNSILAAGKTLSGSNVVAAIETANTILTNALTVDAFVTAVGLADLLAIQKLGFKGEEEKAKQWYSLNLNEIMSRLQEWATAGDKSAATILASMNAFAKSTVDVMNPLWDLVDTIVRPANDVRSYADLSRLVHTLYGKGLVDKMNPRRCPATAIVLGVDMRDAIGYVPALDKGGKMLPIMTAGWRFVKAAHKNLTDEQETRLNGLKKKATVGLSADKVLDRRDDGFLFFQVGPLSGALLQVRLNGKGPEVRIFETVGMTVNVSGWASWNTDINAWPDRRLGSEFSAWKNKD